MRYDVCWSRISAFPLKWSMSPSCLVFFPLGHVYCTCDIYIHVEYHVLKKAKGCWSLLEKRLLECGFCSQRVLIRRLSRRPSVPQKRKGSYVVGFVLHLGTKMFLFSVPAVRVTFFKTSAMLRVCIISVIFPWREETLTPYISYSLEKMILFSKMRTLWIPSVFSQSAASFGAIWTR